MWFFNKNKETVFRPVFSDIVRATPFYLDGTDIFDISKRKFVKKVSVKLNNAVYSASLFRIHGETRRFKVAIAPIFNGITAVCYLSAGDYRAAHTHSEESERLNKQILYNWCLKRAAENKEEGYIYSPNCSKRAKINSGATTKVEIETLCLFPNVTATVPKTPTDIDKFVWIYEHEKSSIYGDKNAAMAALENYFKNF